MEASRITWACCFITAASLATGCAAVVDFPDDPQLVVEVEVERAQSALGSDFSCLTEPAAARAPEEPIASMRILACDALRGCSSPIAGLRGRVCDKLDVDCIAPLFTGSTDASGAIDVELPTNESGFDGYLELSAPAELCTNSAVFGEAGAALCQLLPECDPEAPDERCMIPTQLRTLQFFNPPIVATPSEPLEVQVISSAAVLGLTRATRGELNPALGYLSVASVDCEGIRAPGIRYSLGQTAESVRQIYMESGVLSSARGATDSTGVGLFTGVPPGFVDVAAFTEAGLRVGGVGVVAAPMTLTTTALVPEGWRDNSRD